MKPTPWLLAIMLLTLDVRACIWDAESLDHEKNRSKDLATAIVGEALPPDDPAKLQARIAELQAHRDETNADWWNNLAGAYLRLNQPADAVKLLEPVLTKFPDNYGIHANLGTAYHLLGRYADAEKEIARDLEINPEAHFGLEKYHLALLQYLVRDAKYKSRHVYVDELTAPFLMDQGGRMDFYTDEYASARAQSDLTNGLAEAENELTQLTGTNLSNWDEESLQLLAEICTLDEKPAYRKKWNLEENTNFEAGTIYMAQMNPKEPAAIEMLGVAAWHKRDYHLAVSAFEKAIALGSPQSDLLKVKITGLNRYITEATASRSDMRSALIGGWILVLSVLSLFVFLVWHIYRTIRNRARRQAVPN